MSKVIKFVKKEAVLFISLAAALISMIFTPPNPEYLGYVDWSTLGLLFCLMAAVQGFGSIGDERRVAADPRPAYHRAVPQHAGGLYPHRSSRDRCGKPRLHGYPDGESAEPLYLLAFQHAGRGFLPGNAASNGAQPCAAPALRADYPPQ